MYPITPRYWIITEGDKVISADRAQWLAFSRDAGNFLLAKTMIDPGFTIVTRFLGVQNAGEAPIIYMTTVFTDLGPQIRTSRTHAEAVLMHTMECQRIKSVVDRNFRDLETFEGPRRTDVT